MPRTKEKKERTKLQRLSLNIKIVILLVVLIIVGFFVAYMISTSLEEVIDTEKNTGTNQSGEQTTVYEINEPSEN